MNHLTVVKLIYQRTQVLRRLEIEVTKIFKFKCRKVSAGATNLIHVVI